MGIRALSSFAALPILFIVLYLGGITVYFAAMIIALIGLYEFYQSMKAKGHHPAYLPGMALTVMLYLPPAFQIPFRFVGLGAFLMLGYMLVHYLYSKKQTIIDLALTVMGVVYFPLAFFHVSLIDQVGIPNLVWYIFILAWITDTCAYFGGYFWGKHKLWEAISPKKTVEGAISGVVGCTVITFAIASVLNHDLMLWFIPLAIIGSILSQMGDLIASKIKRYTGVKDFGNIMPGHGGVLDRFDSVVMTTPLVYYFGVILTEFIK